MHSLRCGILFSKQTSLKKAMCFQTVKHLACIYTQITTPKNTAMIWSCFRLHVKLIQRTLQKCFSWKLLRFQITATRRKVSKHVIFNLLQRTHFPYTFPNLFNHAVRFIHKSRPIPWPLKYTKSTVTPLSLTNRHVTEISRKALS